MTKSAIRRGRQGTGLRIAEAAQILADERGGIDGFTMDELAEAADVSRRTLFNYYPSKVDAVMGPDLVIPAEALAVFTAAGPTGDLIEDLQALVFAILDNEGVDPEELARIDRLIHANPVLLANMKQRFHALVARVVAAAAKRESAPVTSREARIAIAVLAGVADCTINEYLENPALDFAEVFAGSIATVRRLFG